jgi:hypothetical protein
MKRSLLVLSAVLVLFSACSKNNSTPTPTTPATPTNTIPADGWSLDATKYKQVTVVRQPSQELLNAVDGTSGSINSFGAFFKSYPTANGSYKIVGFTPDSTAPYPNAKLKDDEVVLIATITQSSGGNKSYWTTGQKANQQL